MSPATGWKSPYRCATIVAACLALAAAILAVNAGRACGPYLSLRSYLARHFWLPMFYTTDLLLPAGTPGGGVPYAGFSADSAPAELTRLREAYRPLAESNKPNQPPPSFEEADGALERALAPGVLTGNDLEEARLIGCKIALRKAEWNRDLLDEARRKFEAYLASPANPAFSSEARGWLARVYYLQKEYARAALIYLDAVDAAGSPLTRDTLVVSLRWVCSEGADQLWERAEEFFDTPRHALFLVNLLTNERPYGVTDPASRRFAAERGRKVLALIQKRPELFKSGADSDALVMALMRTSLYQGDLAGTMKYAAAVPKSSTLMQNPEFNWMAAIPRFVRRDFAGAEAPLLRMLGAPSATDADRATAAQALVGVYLNTGRPVEALHASFIQNSHGPEVDNWPDVASPRMQWCFYCVDLGLPYLLDARLSEEELRAYLRKYPEPAGELLTVFRWGSQAAYSAPQAVKYSLAVRLARREEYAEAAGIFGELGAAEHAARMQDLAGLLARTKDPASTPAARFEAMFEYGTYIASNPERLFFNDLLWWGMQRYVFLEQYGPELRRDDPRSQPGFTRIERETVLADDRRLRDQQEERWKAYQVFEQVARAAGHSELGRKAAEKIIECLSGINTSRFGREREIRNAISTWSRWLREQ